MYVYIYTYIKNSQPKQAQLHSFPLVGRVATNFSAGVASEPNTSTFSQWSGDAGGLQPYTGCIMPC